MTFSRTVSWVNVFLFVLQARVHFMNHTTDKKGKQICWSDTVPCNEPGLFCILPYKMIIFISLKFTLKMGENLPFLLHLFLSLVLENFLLQNLHKQKSCNPFWFKKVHFTQCLKTQKEDKKNVDGWNVDFLYYYDIF